MQQLERSLNKRKTLQRRNAGGRGIGNDSDAEMRKSEGEMAGVVGEADERVVSSNFREQGSWMMFADLLHTITPILSG